MSFTDSIMGVLGIKAPEVPKEVLLQIRGAMLDELGRYDTTLHKGVFMKIFYADDIDKLWDLRSILLPALNEMHGDGAAMARMDAITELFIGYHPAAKRRRTVR